MAWLKGIDETAGSRDRQHESKPSTYCTMEQVDADEAEAESLEPSPTFLPSPMPTSSDIPPLNLRILTEPPHSTSAPLPLPEGASIMRSMRDGGVVAMSNVMAAAAAAALVGAAQPPPLAWLYPPEDLPVAVAVPSQLMKDCGRLPPPLPLYNPDGLSSSLSPSAQASGWPCAALASLPTSGGWDKLDELFACADEVDHDQPGDPLCLSPPLANAMAAVSVNATANVPAFELDKRVSGSPQTTMAKGWEHQSSAGDEGTNDDEGKESEYTAFLETLLAGDPIV